MLGESDTRRSSWLLLGGLGATLVVIASWIQNDGSAARGLSVTKWVEAAPLDGKLAIYETVFWEPLDTESLRKLLQDKPDFVRGKRILEIGTGSGLVALCCKHTGADHVVATDINPNAVACAKANSARLRLPLDVRLVPSTPLDSEFSDQSQDSSAYVVIRDEEKFDLIVANPPWEDATPKQWSDYALYDQDFALLRSIIVGAKDHLKPGGRLVLVYGCVQAIEVAQRLAAEHDFDCLILDDRDPQSLPSVFLPGMMLGLIPKTSLIPKPTGPEAQ